MGSATRTMSTRFVADILGARKRCLGIVPKWLTDSRETSYFICSSINSPMLYITLAGQYRQTID